MGRPTVCGWVWSASRLSCFDHVYIAIHLYPILPNIHITVLPPYLFKTWICFSSCKQLNKTNKQTTNVSLLCCTCPHNLQHISQTYHVGIDCTDIEYRPQKKVRIQLTVYQREVCAIVGRPGVKGHRNKTNFSISAAKPEVAYVFPGVWFRLENWRGQPSSTWLKDVWVLLPLPQDTYVSLTSHL